MDVVRHPAVHFSGRLALSVPEAAEALGVSERHLRALLPELPHVRLGGRVVLPVEGLREWLKARAQREQNRVDAIVNEVLDDLGSD